MNACRGWHSRSGTLVHKAAKKVKEEKACRTNIKTWKHTTTTIASLQDQGCVLAAMRRVVIEKSIES